MQAVLHTQVPILIANTFAKAKTAATDGFERFVSTFAAAPLAAVRA